MKDSRGKDIERGHRVAYNLSGDVVLGDVIDVQAKHVKVVPVHRPLHVSRCRGYNGRCPQMIVLEQKDCVEML